MSTSEKSPSSAESGFEGAKTYLDLDEATEDVAKSGAHETTHMRGHEDLDKKSWAEKAYREAETQRIVESVDADRREHKELSKADLIHNAAERTIAGRIRLATADIEALEAEKSGQGRGILTRAINKYRHNTKLRLGIAAAAGIGAVALAASGLWMPALGVKVASGALRGAATYIGAREGMEKISQMRQNREGQKSGEVARGETRIPEMKPDQMLEQARRLASEKSDNVIAMIARLQSPHVQERWSDKHQERAGQWLAALRHAELERVETQFRMILTQRTAEGKKLYYKKDVPGELRSMVAASIGASLDHRRDQIKADKRSLRMQKGAAMVLAGVVGASGVLGLLSHAAEHAQHSGPLAHKLGHGVSGAGHEIHGATHGVGQHITEHAHHVAEFFNDNVAQGDTVWGHIGKHMQTLYDHSHGHGAWSQLSDESRNIKIDRAVDIMRENPSRYVPSGNLDLIRPGETVHLPRKVLEEGLKYKLEVGDV
jgi:hypothetical protein